MRETAAAVGAARPRYQQVKEYVITLINTGKLKPRDRVPSENELTQTLGVARMTVNRALRELADDGYVVRLAGVGTFVSESRIHSDVLKVRNIADEIRARGRAYTASVIKLEEVEADERVVERLEVRPGAKIFHSLILHFESGRPIQLESRYVCPVLAPEYLNMDFTKITPNVYLTKVAPLHTAEHVVRAIIPTEEVRKLLDMEINEPCLVLRRRTWTAGRPVSLADLSHPGSRFELIGMMKE